VIDPRIEIAGTLSGIELKTSFRPELVFQFDKVQIYMVQNDPEVDPLAPVMEGFITNQYITANTLKIFALTLTVAGARSLTVLGLLISLGALLLLSFVVASIGGTSKETLVRMKYGSLLVDVQPRSLELDKPAVEVVSVDDLAKLAERNNAMILHEIQGYVHTYLVEGDQITYRYTLNEGPEGQTVLDSDPSISSFNLRQGIERGEFKVYYQPIVSLLDEKIIAVEALMRWQHPQNGLISAKDFIRAAESTGLIDTLGEWMLQVACAQLKEWRADGNPLRLSVNFSRRQLEKDPAQIIARVLTKTGLTADALQIEIPEDSLTVNPKHILANLARLKELGVNISVDGFSGQSSLSSLHELPIDSIKIDRLVIDKVNRPEDAEYIQGIISAALEQGLNVVAEGVETEEQMSFLRSQLCTQAQGYLIARPAPAQELTELLSSHQGSTLSKTAGNKRR
ncbi:MAG: EAL domain-containing protein, partial [Anaerolineaceae bacterium]|nr:EAL domain-containing protein [Anaerolineaceae bacterium]